MLGTTLLAILVLFAAVAFVIARVEGLAFPAPRSTGGLTNSAAEYCRHGCRPSGDRCPLTGSSEGALNCPLWKFIEADVPTRRYASPVAREVR